MRLEDAYQEPYKAWQADPSPRTTGEMLNAMNPIISSALHTYGGPKPSPTLKTRAKVLAADALQGYDPQRGTLKTHMMGQLQRLQRYAAQERASVRIPEAATRQYRTLQTAEEAFKEEKGRTPTYTELANITGLSVRRIANIRNAPTTRTEGGGRTFDDDQVRHAPAVMPRGDELPPWINIVYDDLSPLDQAILEGTLGLHGAPKKTATQLSKDLGISGAAISKRLAQIQKVVDQWEDMQ